MNKVYLLNLQGAEDFLYEMDLLILHYGNIVWLQQIQVFVHAPILSTHKKK